MAYALHTNTDVHHGADLPLILGSFCERDHGKAFDYAIRPDDGTDFAPDCPHIVYVQDGTRYAKVLKTVAWVAVDEAPDGSAVLERWELKGHRVFDTSLVRAGRFAA